MNRTGNRFTDRTGEKYQTNQGYEVTIIKYVSSKECYIRFNDERKTEVRAQMIKIRKGSVNNPYHKTLMGVGYIGEGKHKSTGRAYICWSGIMERSYNPRYKLEKPTYVGVTVHPDWHNFQNFAKWFYENYDLEKMKDWHIDKDLLFPGNKEYSARTCCYIPPAINGIFSSMCGNKKIIPRGVSEKNGRYRASMHKYNKSVFLGSFNTPEEAHEVYMKAKKEYLIEVSEKWRGILSDRVCDAIKNYDISLL